MVKSLGISVGNQNSYVAASKEGGIEILLNEYSNRATPSMVAFTDHSRSIGVDAASNQLMNIKNTIYDLMAIIGGQCKDGYPFKMEKQDDGQLAVVVRHLGQERKFTITQVLAMLFTKLREVGNDSQDCVISCPQYFDENQKKTLVKAAMIAGLNPLQIISDMSAVVLYYAYYRTTKDDSHKFMAFVNIGQSNLQTIVVWLRPKDDLIRVLSLESELIGGRDFDRLLADHFVKEQNLTLSPKAYMKLVSSCEKLKKLLSANSNEIPLHVESLISEDKDFVSRMSRAKFEEVCQSLLQRIETCFKRAIGKAKSSFEDYKIEQRAALEAKSAATDVPMKEEPASESANSDDKSNDIQKPADAEPKDQTASGDKINGEAMEVESQNNESTDAKASADDANQKAPNNAASPKPATPKKADGKKKSSTDNAKADAIDITKVEFKLNGVEIMGGTSRMPAIKQLITSVFGVNPSTTLNTDEAVVRGCVLNCASLHPGTKVKRDVKIEGADAFYTIKKQNCDTERRVELDLIWNDRKHKSRTDARNNLEEFIYAERTKLEKGDKYLDELTNTLEWLFTEEGEDAPEDVYNSKLSDLKKSRKPPVEIKPDEDKPADNSTESKPVDPESTEDKSKEEKNE